MKEKIEQVIAKVKDNKDFAAEFKKNPVKAIKGLLGSDLAEDVIENIIDAVKAKIGTDEVKDKAEGILGKVKKLF